MPEMPHEPQYFLCGSSAQFKPLPFAFSAFNATLSLSLHVHDPIYVTNPVIIFFLFFFCSGVRCVFPSFHILPHPFLVIRWSFKRLQLLLQVGRVVRQSIYVRRTNTDLVINLLSYLSFIYVQNT